MYVYLRIFNFYLLKQIKYIVTRVIRINIDLHVRKD